MVRAMKHTYRFWTTPAGGVPRTSYWFSSAAVKRHTVLPLHNDFPLAGAARDGL